MVDRGASLLDRASSVSTRQRWALPLSIALLGFGLNSLVAAYMAETQDEPAHVHYGALVLQGSPDKSDGTYDSKMPVSALNGEAPRPVGTGKQRTRRV